MKRWRTFTNRNEDARRNLEKIFRSFVKQLSISSSPNDLQASLVQLYHQKREAGFSSQTVTIEESEPLLLKLMTAYTHTVLVLDALDECEPPVRAQLIEIFNRLIDKAHRLKIFVSSRRDSDITYQLGKEANVGIEATDNKNDIGKFVSHTIKEAQARRRNPIPKDLQDEIIQVLLEKSGGMYVVFPSSDHSALLESV